jgi:hypothetical protein
MTIIVIAVTSLSIAATSVVIPAQAGIHCVECAPRLQLQLIYQITYEQ